MDLPCAVWAVVGTAFLCLPWFVIFCQHGFNLLGMEFQIIFAIVAYMPSYEISNCLHALLFQFLATINASTVHDSLFVSSYSRLERRWQFGK